MNIDAAAKIAEWQMLIPADRGVQPEMSFVFDLLGVISPRTVVLKFWSQSRCGRRAAARTTPGGAARPGRWRVFESQ
jgi:hypothetical protein